MIPQVHVIKETYPNLNRYGLVIRPFFIRFWIGKTDSYIIGASIQTKDPVAFKTSMRFALQSAC